MLTKGWGPWRRDWYSICSMHTYHPDCQACQSGRWVNAWRVRASQAVFAISPSLWRRWANGD